jgi:hypothetical protein
VEAERDNFIEGTIIDLWRLKAWDKILKVCSNKNNAAQNDIETLQKLYLDVK